MRNERLLRKFWDFKDREKNFDFIYLSFIGLNLGLASIDEVLEQKKWRNVLVEWLMDEAGAARCKTCSIFTDKAS